jgi:hypothetical protein
METIKTHWHETPRPYSTYDIEISENLLTYKEWWDTGHDPNRLVISLSDFETSKVAQDIVYNLGETIYQEVLESVKKLLEKKKRK